MQEANMKANTPRGVRNRNPGNLRRSSDPWQGLAPEQSDPEFFTFVSMPHGIRAMARVLIAYQDRHGIRTIRKIVNRYAPPTENRTASYIDVVANRVERRPDEDLDLHSYADLRPLIEAMIEVEVGRAHGITPAQFDEGLRMAGVTPPVKPVAKEPAVVAGGAVATVTAAAQVVSLDSVAQALPLLQQAKDIAPWLPLVAIAAFGAWFVWTRVKARRDGLS